MTAIRVSLLSTTAALALVLAAGAPSAARAAEAAGYLKTVSGAAVVVRGDSEQPATPGAAIHPADIIRTGADGAVGVTFKDDTRISIGPDTEFAIDSYAFDPRQNKLDFASRVQRGTLQYLSGAIARLEPDAVSVETPSGTIGVRGTRFVVKVDE